MGKTRTIIVITCALVFFTILVIDVMEGYNPDKDACELCIDDICGDWREKDFCELCEYDWTGECNEKCVCGGTITVNICNGFAREKGTEQSWRRIEC